MVNAAGSRGMRRGWPGTAVLGKKYKGMRFSEVLSSAVIHTWDFVVRTCVLRF